MLLSRNFSLLPALVFLLLVLGSSLPLAQSVTDQKAGVVKITATDGGQQRIGTGFIVAIEDEAAYIVTAAHVVAGATLTINFYPKADKDHEGIIRNMQGADTKDLAVVKVQF